MILPQHKPITTKEYLTPPPPVSIISPEFLANGYLRMRRRTENSAFRRIKNREALVTLLREGDGIDPRFVTSKKSTRTPQEQTQSRRPAACWSNRQMHPREPWRWPFGQLRCRRSGTCQRESLSRHPWTDSARHCLRGIRGSSGSQRSTRPTAERNRKFDHSQAGSELALSRTALHMPA